MPQQMNKGQAGMGGRGKNQLKGRQDKGTRRKGRIPKLAEANIPGSPSGKNPRKRNQKRNQREWRQKRELHVRKANWVPADV
jgi:hypothetical protein